MTTTPKTGTCPQCGNPIEWEPVMLFGKEILSKAVPICDDCDRLRSTTVESRETTHLWHALFTKRMPPLYRSADPAQVSRWFAPVLAWSPQHHPGGVGLIGESGEGKSCALSCLLRSLEKPFRWWSGTEARDAAIDAATADRDREGARARWEAAMAVPILVLDDISQGKMTEAWSSKLFDLLETRLSNGLPTFWTSQITLPQLRQKIASQNGGDSAQAEAISRRLAQHSLVLPTP